MENRKHPSDAFKSRKWIKKYKKNLFTSAYFLMWYMWINFNILTNNFCNSFPPILGSFLYFIFEMQSLLHTSFDFYIIKFPILYLFRIHILIKLLFLDKSFPFLQNYINRNIFICLINIGVRRHLILIRSLKAFISCDTFLISCSEMNLIMAWFVHGLFIINFLHIYWSSYVLL